MQLQRNVDEEGGNYYEDIAELNLDLDEGDFSRSSTRCRSTDSAEVPLVQGLELGQGGLARGLQLCRNVDNEGGKYSKMIAEVCLPSSEPTLLQSPPSQ